MSMRYIIRRQKPEDLKELQSVIPDLTSKLGKPDANLRRGIKVESGSMHQYVQYQFQTRKEGTAYVWICPSIELVAEDEKSLFALTDKFNVPKPSHLQHLAAT